MSVADEEVTQYDGPMAEITVLSLGGSMVVPGRIDIDYLRAALPVIRENP